MKLILFFNGWGVPKLIFHKLNDNTSKDHKTYIIDLEESILDLNIDFNDYSEINIIAWSFGVYNASKQLDNLINIDNKNSIINKINKKIAINGTEKSIDRKYGIPPIIFKNTLNNMNSLNYFEFLKNSGIPKNYLDSLCNIDDLILKKYIKILKDFGENYGDTYSIFDKAIISKEDKIFNYKNQVRFYRDISYKILENQHYLFDRWNNWEEVLDEF